jgi:hypothetical protein
VRRLAQPKDLPLQLGDALVPCLKGEVAAGDHDADAPRPERLQNDVRQAAVSLDELDLEQDAHVASSVATESCLRRGDVARVPDEGQSQDVGSAGGELEVVDQVLGVAAMAGFDPLDLGSPPAGGSLQVGAKPRQPVDDVV